MESKTRCYSCRLAVHDSGRVRWCIGNEKSWRSKLKLLVFLPIVLLAVTILVLVINHLIFKFSTPAKNNHNYNLTDISSFHYDPAKTFTTTQTSRYKRNIEMPTNSHKVQSFLYNTHQNFYLVNVDNQHQEQNQKSHHQNFWTTKITKDKIRTAQANLMKRFMDEKEDPCTDFYQYACGNWAKYNPIPADRTVFDTFEMLRENLDSVLKELLEEEDGDDDSDLKKTKIWNASNNNVTSKRLSYLPLDIPSILSNENIIANMTPFRVNDAVTKAKYLYKSCMNLDLLEKRGSRPLHELLKRLGSWPMIDSNWDETHFDWIWLVGQLRLYNNDILISEWVGPDIKNSNEFVLQIDQTTLGLPTRDYFLDPINFKYVSAYKNYMISIATLLGAPIAKATEDAEDIIDFETKLAQIIAPPDFRKNVTEIYKRLTIGELHAYIPQINWMKYFKIVSGGHIEPTQPLVCYSIKYLQNLVILLSKTPRRTVSNYIIWRFVRHRVNNLGRGFQEAKQRFYFILFGRERAPSRWQTCVTQVNSNMGMALGNMFVRRYFDENSKNDTLQMTKEIQDAFREILADTLWLDSDTKKLAKYKIDAMRLKIGYPDFILDRNQLAERYMDVKVHPDLYFENTLSILRHLTRVEQKRLGTVVNKNLWNTAPAVVNAYYSRNKNQIMFPAGILQPPFYQKYFPRSLNYGGIGVVIGHEITHGFDDKGRLFDKEGNLQKWWSESAIISFHLRTQCLIDQYNNFIIPEVNLPVDGTNTQGENIADNGGIKQSYK
ncbi:neprilysin-4 isoform X2 [Agrilus planipennis]|nr:neprilysin-4 isoform X2 [Agrilus planipennis]